MSRQAARENAFLFLYQIEIQKDHVEKQRENFLENFSMDPADEAFFDELVHGVCDKKEWLDERISEYLRKWTVDRIPKVDLTILRIAVYELYFATDVPPNVAISEAVILSRKYSDEDARSYINAVLGNIFRAKEES